MKMLPPQVVVVEERSGERRRRGRPTLSEDGAPSAQVHFAVPNGDYDAAFQLAKLDRVDISDVFRRAISKHVREELARRAEVARSNAT